MQTLEQELAEHETKLREALRIGKKDLLALTLDEVPCREGKLGHIWVRLIDPSYYPRGIHIAYKPEAYGFRSLEDLNAAILKYFEGKAKLVKITYPPYED